MNEAEWLASVNTQAMMAAVSGKGGNAFDLLPILADAPEQAACINANILAHLRSPGGHVRGCPAVDVLLGKK